MTYFDNAEKQYPVEQILNPPLHTQKEIGIILEIIKKNKIKSVVDFGAGTGRLTIPLLRNNIKTTAVDISSLSLKKISILAKKINKKKLIAFSDKIPNKRIQAFVGADILHHIKIDDYFKLFSQRLSRGGMIVFSEPNFFNPSWFFFVTFFLDWREEKRMVFSTSLNLVGKLKKHGFSGIKFTGLGLLPPIFFNRLPVLARLNYWLGELPLLKYFAYRLIISAHLKTPFR